MHYDAQLVLQSEGRLPNYRAIAVPVLLLGGSDSPTYLQRTLDALQTTLPHVRRVELLGVGHLAPDNTGEPERVAGELRTFLCTENSA
jgi:pimeloyl-ACP methyl ester carboxylesterase